MVHQFWQEESAGSNYRGKRMIVIDFNEMTLEELITINNYLGFEFLINDGKITGREI